MLPVSVSRKLTDVSQFHIDTDAACMITDVALTGGKLLRATIGAPASPLELLDKSGRCAQPHPWAPGEPITIVAEPSAPGDTVRVTVERSERGAVPPEPIEVPDEEPDPPRAPPARPSRRGRARK